jgi:hypothetical protein
MKKKQKGEMTASDFIALPDSEKDRIIAEIESITPEERLAKSKPLNARERAEWREIQKNMRRSVGRPKVGNGVQKVSVSIERSLMDRVDAYAKTHKLNRSKLFAMGVANLIHAGNGK